MFELDNLETFLPLIVPLGMIIIFTLLIRSRNQLLEQEKHWPARYRTICSAKIGLYNYSWPFVRLSIYENFLVIKSWKAELINFSQINYLKIPVLPAIAGLLLNFQVNGKSRTINIYVLKSAPLIQALEGKVKISH